MICEICGHKIESTLRQAFEARKGDSGLRLYEVFGQELFVVYGASGGISTRKVFYLLKELGDGNALVLPAYLEDDVESSVQKALSIFDTECRRINLAKDDLGVP